MGLFVSAADGTAATPILSDPALWPLAPQWSPDGSLVAFSGGEGRGPAAVVGVVRADGSGVVWTESTGSIYPFPLDWSPDGTRLGWASESGARSHLWVADANGDNAVRLAEVIGTIEGIAWAPDGGRLAFHVVDYAPEFPTSSVTVIGADGSVISTFAASDAGSMSPEYFRGAPAWSLDGATIAISLTRGVALIGASDGVMAVLPVPGMEIYQVAWSPDNATFALSAYDEDEEFEAAGEGGGPTGWDIYLMNADGTDFRVLAATPLEDLYPAWSPDGRSVAFHAEPAGE
jgi:Tol biopolymer transport system component